MKTQCAQLRKRDGFNLNVGTVNNEAQELRHAKTRCEKVSCGFSETLVLKGTKY